MRDGTYIARFMSNGGVFGAGVVIISGTEIRGGDSAYSYAGEFQQEAGFINAHLTIRSHLPGAMSIFGTADEGFVLDLRGAAARPKAVLNGNVRGQPGRKITVELTAQQEMAA